MRTTKAQLSTCVVRFLDNIILLVSIPEISSIYLAYMAAHAGLSLPWSQTPKTGFLMTSSYGSGHCVLQTPALVWIIKLLALLSPFHCNFPVISNIT